VIEPRNPMEYYSKLQDALKKYSAEVKLPAPTRVNECVEMAAAYIANAAPDRSESLRIVRMNGIFIYGCAILIPMYIIHFRVLIGGFAALLGVFVTFMFLLLGLLEQLNYVLLLRTTLQALTKPTTVTGDTK
jgi:hypothetical protein